MKKFHCVYTLLPAMYVAPVLADTVEQTSDAYKTGQYIGYAFGAALLFLIIKKLSGK